jgi:hypothetical protein
MPVIAILSKTGDNRDEAKDADATASGSPDDFLSALQSNVYLSQVDATAVEVLDRTHGPALVALLVEQEWTRSEDDAPIKAALSASPPD